MKPVNFPQENFVFRGYPTCFGFALSQNGLQWKPIEHFCLEA